MEQELVIKSVEQKTAKTGTSYLLVETLTGRYSCWNPAIYEQLTALVSHKTKCLVEEQANGFKNILGLGDDLGIVEMPKDAPSTPKPYNKGFGMGSSMEKASEAKKDSMIWSNCLNNSTSYGSVRNLSWETIVDNAIIAFKKFDAIK